VKAAPRFDTTSVTSTGMMEREHAALVGIAQLVGLIDMLGAVLAASGGDDFTPRDSA